MAVKVTSGFIENAVPAAMKIPVAFRTFGSSVYFFQSDIRFAFPAHKKIIYGINKNCNFIEQSFYFKMPFD